MRKLSILIICLIFIASCGKKEVKQISPDSKLALESFAVSERIKEAYLKRDMDSLKDNSTTEGYREIIASMKDFSKAELSFTPRWVEIDKANTVQLNVSWSGKWTNSKGSVTEEKGMAVFMLEGAPLKMRKILRGNPFIYPE